MSEHEEATSNNVKPCPNCGHCPTCGNTPQQAIPWYPIYPWYTPTITTGQYIVPSVTWGGETNPVSSGGMTLGNA